MRVGKCKDCGNELARFTWVGNPHRKYCLYCKKYVDKMFKKEDLVMKKKYIKIVINHNELKIYLKADYDYMDLWKTFENREELLQFLNDYLTK